ncbi:MAG: chemotaxis protein CheD [Candidatus Marinimicrobia bacterium]|nr:chemotaxis protein CheD [Candidatus Neomarinimicrobiota bacterium]MCF7880485.1 chemotaxis protein CheD [Candidatus Neomarinimicrobiota bacterium]
MNSRTAIKLKEHIVDIADIKVSNNPGEVLVTFALGSCLGIAVYDPGVKVAGLAHIMLPDSAIEDGNTSTNLNKYIDTGVPVLYKKMYTLGAKKERIKNAIIGGSKIMDDQNFFNIGNKNYAALRKVFWKNNVLIHKKHVGGRINRTVRIEVATGKITLKLSSGETIQL